MLRRVSGLKVLKNTFFYYSARLKKLSGRCFLLILKWIRYFFAPPAEITKKALLAESVDLEKAGGKKMLVNIHFEECISGAFQAAMLRLMARFPNKKLLLSVGDFDQVLDETASLKSVNVRKMFLQFFAKNALLNFIDCHENIALYSPNDRTLKKMLSIKIGSLCVSVVCVSSFLLLSVLFGFVFLHNNKQLDALSEKIQILSQTYLSALNPADKKLAAFDLFFQDYQVTKNRFYLIDANLLEKTVNKYLFSLFQKHYYQPLVMALRQRLLQLHEEWPKNKSIRGEYFAYWLAYLDLKNPHAILTDAIAFQVKTVLSQHYDVNLSEKVTRFYLHYLKATQAPHTLLLSSPVLHAVSLQLSGDHFENLYQFFRFLEIHKLGKLGLSDFVKKSNLLVSNALLPNMFLKSNWYGQVLPAIHNMARQLIAYTWFDTTVNMQQAPFRMAMQERYFLDAKQYWAAFLKSVSIRPTNSLLLASDFIKSLSSESSDYKAFLQKADNNLNFLPGSAHFLINWKHYNKQLAVLSQDCHYLLLNENTGLAARQVAQAVLLGKQTHLGQAKNQIDTMVVSINNPKLAVAVKQYLQAPLRFYWKTLLINAKNNLQQAFASHVLRYYQKFLKNKFPFTRVSQEASPGAVKTWLIPKTGLYWQFLDTSLYGFLSLKKSWVLNRWLGVGLPVQEKFINRTNQLWLLATKLFQKNQYHLLVKFYPVPSPDITEQVLQLSGQQWLYQNGPQIWQSYVWKPSMAPIILKVHYKNSELTYKKQFQGDWGLFRFLTDTGLKNKRLALLIKPPVLVKILLGLLQNNQLALF